MRLQGIVFRLLTWGIVAAYIWIKDDLMLIIPAAMTVLIANAYHRLKDDLKPHAEPGDEKHE